MNPTLTPTLSLMERGIYPFEMRKNLIFGYSGIIAEVRIWHKVVTL